MNTILTSYINTLISLFNKNVKHNFNKGDCKLALKYIEILERNNIPQIERTIKEIADVRNIDIEELVNFEDIKRQLKEYKAKCLEEINRRMAA
ncbi:MAG: hypothetical protein PHF86_05525 [Candidatus Nanoarchaeia archaeon]|nr:hypothetical protein [Candidatus Nanoarchaeia archaeon]